MFASVDLSHHEEFTPTTPYFQFMLIWLLLFKLQTFNESSLECIIASDAQNPKKSHNLSGQSIRTSMQNMESVAQKMAELFH